MSLMVAERRSGLPGGKLPFIMKPDGIASIFGPGMAEGPFPEHYEALECPLEVNSMSKQRINPTIKIFGDKMDASFSCDARFPFVCTTYRVSEHWQTGCHDAALFLAAGNAAPELRGDER